jgi:hypothetical protein
MTTTPDFFENIEAFFEHMALPETSYLGRSLTSSLVSEQSGLNSDEAKLFAETVEQLIWRNALKTENTGLSEYSTAQRRYTEVHVLHVQLKANPKLQTKFKALSQLMHRIIPYPVILVLQQHHKIAISLADKLVHAANDSLVIDHIYHTAWLNLYQRDGLEANFLRSFTLRHMPHSDFYQLYQGLISKLMCLILEVHPSEQTTPDGVHLSFAEKKQLMIEWAQLNQALSQVKKKIKLEKSQNQKIVLNTQAHTMKQRKEQLQQRIL